MCTVTWLRQPDRYQVFFNRDEKKTRPPAAPPSIHIRAGTRILAPVDPQGGGSWLAANEWGLTVALLNHYPAERPSAAPRTSRGRLVMDLAGLRSLDDVSAQLSGDAPGNYNSFFLLAFADGRPPLQFIWDGRTLVRGELGDRDRPVTTSSFETRAVTESRRAAYAAAVKQSAEPNPDELLAFHRSRHEPGAFGVFMDRPDAQTVSFSRITVTPKNVEFYYAPRDSHSPAFPKGRAYVLDRK